MTPDPDHISTIRDVSDTALWVAYCRARESERPDALFRDPYAAPLAGERGKSIALSMGPTMKYTQYTLSIRTVIIDRYIEKLAREEGVDLVLNLGAGLDSRPYRMTTLPSSLQWIEVDHPHLIEQKDQFFASEKPSVRLERVRLDLANREARKKFFAEVCGRGKKILVLTEGVLPYLTEEQVSDLAADLRSCDTFKFWIAEYFHQAIFRRINTRRRMKKMANAPFLFHPEDWFGFFKSCGWNERETQFLGEEGQKLGRNMPAPWWAFLVAPFISKEKIRAYRRMAGYVLFERVNKN